MREVDSEGYLKKFCQSERIFSRNPRHSKYDAMYIADDPVISCLDLRHLADWIRSVCLAACDVQGA